MCRHEASNNVEKLPCLTNNKENCLIIVAVFFFFFFLFPTERILTTGLRAASQVVFNINACLIIKEHTMVENTVMQSVI